MTRFELCEELRAAADTPPGILAAAWERRRSELLAAVSADGNAKPVKLRLRRELNRLDEGAALAGQLRVAADFARYLGELEAEWAKPAPRRSVARLCLDRARPLLGALADAELRFDCEKRLAEEEERLAAAPPARAAETAPKTVLELIPLSGGGTGQRPRATVRLVARSFFTLGRQTGADFSTRFGPETAENRQKTGTISRINTTLFFRDGQICVEDGGAGPEGMARPSRNGTLVDGQRLSGAIPLDRSREHRLKLGQFFFEVSALPLEGCVRFLAISPSAAPLVGIWLLSEATLGSGADTAIALEGPLPAVAARIHHGEAGFALTVPSEGSGLVKLDGRAPAPGENLPLQGAKDLWVGAVRYTLQLR